MSTLSELLAQHTQCSGAAVAHLQRIVAEWQLLADLAFADLLMWAPLDAAEAPAEFLCVAHVRPTTGPTVHPEDVVGSRADDIEFPQLRQALRHGGILRDDQPRWLLGVPVRHEVVPVRLGERRIAVLGREANLAVPRVPSPLEIAYLGIATDLCQMLADGTFPDAGTTPDRHGGPRAGDGLLRLDAAGSVIYASPNALSAYHRMGHAADLRGEQLAPLTRELISDPFDAAEVAQRIRAAIQGSPSTRIEADAAGATMLFRALPLRPRGASVGALVLVRDVTELRSRDRALLSKDATIREIHHRVKNNLQTVAALLRLQSRRTANIEARQALQESVRRVDSIAMVHETLSISLDERVDIDDVVDKVLSMVAEVSGEESRVVVRREGAMGVLAAELAMPLVMVLTELVQNALEHAFDQGQGGEVVLRAERSAGSLEVIVSDDGRGLPVDFSPAQAERLGLQIVRTLVGSELRGSLELQRRQPHGTMAVLRLPLTARR
ncbi:MAG: histidine kinase N-terminal domain-containing protein [Pseudonocardiales bacterium]|nr:histidine kinase N-terminal domain-containing protein [Pseudonocardiales bacterium]MBV9031006.1 histidine kinase N-terminal domain-containing protein [Pseudonocardiales bacterium]